MTIYSSFHRPGRPLSKEAKVSFQERGVELGSFEKDARRDVDVWRVWEANGFRLAGDKDRDEDAFAAMRHVRNLSGMKEVGDYWLRRAGRHLGASQLSGQNLQHLLGQLSNDEIGRAFDLAEIPRRKAVREETAGTREEVLRSLPATMRERMAAHVADHRFAARRMFVPRQIGRVLRLRPRWLRLVGVCSILRQATGQAGTSSLIADLTALEKAAEVFGEVQPRPMARAIAKFWEDRDGENAAARARAIKGLLTAVNTAREWLRQLGGWTDPIRSLLPADLASRELRGEVSKVIKERSVARGEEREAKIGQRPLSPQDLRERLDARLDQVRSFRDQVEDAMRECLRHSDADLHFKVAVPALRADATVVPNVTQELRVRVTRASRLLWESFQAESTRSRRNAAGLVYREIANGPRDVPMVVVEGVVADEKLWDCPEPFFFDLYRWAIMDSRGRRSAPIEIRRSALLASAGFERSVFRPISGVFAFPAPLRRITKYLREGAKPIVVIPVDSLYLGMLLARLGYEQLSKSGMRSFEVLQTALGKEALVEHVLEDGPACCVRARAKNGKHRYFPLTPSAVELIREIAFELRRRWFPSNRTDRVHLPVCQSAFHYRYQDMDVAEYLFRNEDRPLDGDEFNLIVNLAMFGLDYRQNHDERFYKATAMGKSRKVSQRAMDGFFGWDAGSGQRDHYDRSGDYADFDPEGWAALGSDQDEA